MQLKGKRIRQAGRLLFSSSLNKEYLEKLQGQATNGEQEVAIWFPKKSTALLESEFWKIIALLDWKKRKATTIMAACLSKLKNQNPPSINPLIRIQTKKIQTTF